MLQGAFDLAQAFHQAGVEHAALSVQDAVRDADLADIVQSRSQRDDILLLVCDEILSGVHGQPFQNALGQGADALHMQSALAVAELHDQDLQAGRKKMIYQPGYTSVQGNTSTSLEKWDLQIQACQPGAAGNLFGNNEYAAQLIQRETGGSGRRRCKSCLAQTKKTPGGMFLVRHS